jgi:hypothetical protein
MILATHGFLASSIGQIDADAQAFFDRVDTAGGTLSFTEKVAVNNLVLKMKTDGIWTKMKAIYPMVGGGTGTTAARQAACSQNLVSSSFTGTFTSTGWTFASTGVTPNGTSAFMNSQLNASTNLSVTSLSFGGYTATTLNGTGYNGAYPPDYLMMSFKSFNFCEFYRTNGTALDISGGIVGMVQANQLSTDSKIYTNNTIGKSGTITMTSLPNQNMYVGAANNNGTARFFDNKLISYYYYADGLTDTEASNHYTAVQAFQTTLSRNV